MVKRSLGYRRVPSRTIAYRLEILLMLPHRMGTWIPPGGTFLPCLRPNLRQRARPAYFTPFGGRFEAVFLAAEGVADSEFSG